MKLTKQKGEKVEDYFYRIRKEGYSPKVSYQNIDMDVVKKILQKLDRYSDDMLDVIYCLSNNELPSLFSKISNSHKISSGASVAHIGSYIGILLRGKNKLDREGRDYWIKPLVEIGILDPVTLISDNTFIYGHPKAKSPNSAYVLNSDFVLLVQNINPINFESMIKSWVKSSEKRKRMIITIEKNSLPVLDNSHKSLIDDSINIYAKNYLPDYVCVFKDADNGDRITKNEKLLLNEYGIVFGKLNDVWPDAILFNPKTNSLWFIEAVTSDGEVDNHKLNGFKRICTNSNKNFGGCTTTYFTIKRFYERQNSQNNLAPGSYFWIKEFPEKHFSVN